MNCKCGKEMKDLMYNRWGDIVYWCECGIVLIKMGMGDDDQWYEPVIREGRMMETQKKKEEARFFAEISIDGIRLAHDSLNTYARELGYTDEKECLIVLKWPQAHKRIAYFLTGHNFDKNDQNDEIDEWQCPFCGKWFVAT